MTELVIRRAVSVDLPVVRDLLVETWHATYDSIYGVERVTTITKSWHSLDALEARLRKPRSSFLVAEDSRRLCGMAFAAVDGDRAALFLFQLYVLPSAQAQGTGTALLAETILSFPEARQIEAEVEESNDGAVTFYQRRGFALVSRMASDKAGEQPTILMLRKRLAESSGSLREP